MARTPNEESSRRAAGGADATAATTGGSAAATGPTSSESVEAIFARAVRGCGFPSRDSDSTDRLRHLARELLLSALSPGLDGVLADGVRRSLEASAAPGVTPREARYALARQVGRGLRWVPGQPPVEREVRERACLLLAVLARVDRQEYEKHGVRVPAESSLEEMRRWVTDEGIDRKVSALLREAEVGGLAADDFCNRVEGLLRSIEERERVVGDRPIITVSKAPGSPTPPGALTDLTDAGQVPPTAKPLVPTAPAPPTVPKPRPCDLKALAQYERAIELHPELAARDADMKDVYDVVREEVHDRSEDGPLKDFQTWRRYVNRARHDPAAPKRSPRAGREGRNVVDRDDI